MSLRGTRVGKAYVEGSFDGEGINQDIVDSVDEAGPGVEKAGREHGERYREGFDDGMAARLGKRLRSAMDRVTGDFEDEGDDSGEAFGTAFTERLRRVVKRNGPRAGREMADEFGEEFQNRVQIMFAETLDQLVADSKQVLRERRQQVSGNRLYPPRQATMDPDDMVRFMADLIDKRFDAAASKAEEDFYDRKERLEESARIKHFDTLERIAEKARVEEEKFYDRKEVLEEAARRQHFENLERLAEKTRIKEEQNQREWMKMLGIQRQAAEMNLLYNKGLLNGQGQRVDAQPRTSTATRVNAFGDRFGALLGRGSRNNFLNFIGSTFRNIVRLGGAAISVIDLFAEGMESAGKGASTFARVGGGLAAVVSKIGTGLVGLIPLVLGATAALTILASIGSGVLSVLTSLSATIVSGLTGAAIVGAGAFTALASAGGLAAVALSNLTKEQKKIRKEAFSSVGDAVDDLAGRINRDLVPAFDDMGEYLTKFIRRLNPLGAEMGNAFATVGRTLTQSLLGPGFRKLTREFEDSLPRITINFGAALGQFANGMAGVFAAVTPQVETFSKYLADTAKAFSQFANSRRGQNRITDFVDRAVESLKNLKDFTGEVFGLLGDLLFSPEGQRAGGDLFDSMTRVIQRLRGFIADGDLEKWFQDGVRFGRDFGTVIENIAKILGDLSESGVLNALTGALKGMSSVIEAVTNALGPNVVADLAGLAASLVLISKITGLFKVAAGIRAITGATAGAGAARAGAAAVAATAGGAAAGGAAAGAGGAAGAAATGAAAGAAASRFSRLKSVLSGVAKSPLMKRAGWAGVILGAVDLSNALRNYKSDAAEATEALTTGSNAASRSLARIADKTVITEKEMQTLIGSTIGMQHQFGGVVQSAAEVRQGLLDMGYVVRGSGRSAIFAGESFNVFQGRAAKLGRNLLLSSSQIRGVEGAMRGVANEARITGSAAVNLRGRMKTLTTVFGLTPKEANKVEAALRRIARTSADSGSGIDKSKKAADRLNEALGGLKVGAGKGLDGLDKVGRGATDAGNSVERGGRQATRGFNDIADGATRAMGRARNAVNTGERGIRAGLNGITGSARTSRQRIDSEFGKLPGIAGQNMSAMAGRIRGAGPQIEGASRSAASGAASAARGARGSFESTGSFIILGLAAGIGQSAGAAAAAAALAADNAARAARGAAQVKSPSRVFMRIGRFMSEGLALGITSGGKKATKAAKELAEQVIKVSRNLTKAFTKAAKAETKGDARSLIRDQIRDLKSLARETKNANVERLARNSIKVLETQDKMNKKFIRRLVNGAKVANASLVDYARARQIVTARLEKANQKLADAISVRRDYRAQITEGARSFAGLLTAQAREIDGVTQALTAQDITANLTDRLTQLNDYASNLKILVSQGLGDDAYKQLVDAGVEGGSAFVNALVAGGAGSIGRVNELLTKIRESSSALGADSSSHLYDAGVQTARGLAEGLESQQERISKAAERLGKTITRAIRKSLKIKSPSVAMIEQMEQVGAGMVVGLDRQRPKVENAAVRLSSAVAISPSLAARAAQGNAVSGNQPGTGPNITMNVHTPTKDPKAVAVEAVNEMTGRII